MRIFKEGHNFKTYFLDDVSYKFLGFEGFEFLKVPTVGVTQTNAKRGVAISIIDPMTCQPQLYPLKSLSTLVKDKMSLKTLMT